MQAFLASLDLDYHQIYTCERCSEGNLTVIMDGKEMGIRHIHARKHERPLAVGAATVNIDCPHADIVPLNSNQARQLLQKLCANLLTSDEFQQLLQLCQSVAPDLGDLLQSICEDCRDASDTIHCPEKYRRLFEAVSTNYPAAAFLHPLYADSQFEHVLQQQQHIGHVEAADMHHGFPLLHAIVQQCSWDVIPSDWLPFLKHLAKQASAAGRASAIPQYAADDCHEDLHCFLPSFPVCRSLPPFKADRRKIDDGPSCPKYARTHPLLTPGAFTIFCAHGLCLGFSLMASQEGPRTPFEILFTRFKEAPSMVVYDNACNLQRYVMKRAPHFFRHTAFRIDRLHVYAHKGCSSGYNLGEYPAQMAVANGISLIALNTQVAEQVNSLLESIRTQVAFMTHDNAMMYIKYYLAKYNMRLRQKWSRLL